ncbi:hypothetical protein AVEN_88591-1 [Araneus ventricosus]|uniref:Uncharacterized protein n=1 Tax=Araneus ventricosus TaxID=182803 RepID=A0A4Y2U088_ARAVE|nr:hypothetical protein AVEN_88591-1 [Araneus ventricosus]
MILKSTGGLIHGSYIFDSTLTKWILTKPIITAASQQVADFCGLSFTSSEHHTDASDSKILRDNEDVQELVGWFESHDLWCPSVLAFWETKQ